MLINFRKFVTIIYKMGEFTTIKNGKLKVITILQLKGRLQFTCFS